MAKIVSTKPTTKYESVTLELTGDEADLLFCLLQFVGGDPVHSRRKYVDKIADAFRAKGYERYDNKDLTGAIRFNDTF